MRLRSIATGWALALAIGGGALASPTSVARGRLLAQLNCSTCHAIAGAAQSPMQDAPRFPELERISGGRSLEEIFAEVTLTRHPPMPSFLGNDAAMSDLLDYIRSVQERTGRPSTRPQPQ